MARSDRQQTIRSPSSRDATRSDSDPVTPAEFSLLMAELCVGCGALRFDGQTRQNVPEITAGQLDVYYRVVQDVPAAILSAAVRLLIATSTWRGLPTSGAIRQACVDVAIGPQLTEGEAWEIVRRALGRLSEYDQPDVYRAKLQAVPDAVREVAGRFGWAKLREMSSADARRAFCREWSLSRERQRERLLLPGLWPSRLALPAVPQVKALAVSGDSGG